MRAAGRWLIPAPIWILVCWSSVPIWAVDTDLPLGEKLFSGSAVPGNVAELKAMEELQRRVGQQMIRCTVNLRVGMAQGSGVIVSEDGYVLTAAHVAQRPDEKVVITFSDGRHAEATTLGLNRSSDAALVKITSAGKWPYLEIDRTDDSHKGQWCLAAGHPGGLERERKPVVRVGRILAKNRDLLVSDCTLVGGDSGGPLVDGRGRVIGIHSRIGSQLTANMHVPSKQFVDHWDRLVAHEAWGHMPGQTPFLGVQGGTEGNTARIARVYLGSAAEKGGIKVGDVITHFDGKQVADFATLSALVADRQSGDRIKVRALRGEEAMELDILLERRNN